MQCSDLLTRADLIVAGMMVLSYTETIKMSAVAFDALMFAISEKQRINREYPDT